jgi:hypothetical protein
MFTLLSIYEPVSYQREPKRGFQVERTLLRNMRPPAGKSFHVGSLTPEVMKGW